MKIEVSYAACKGHGKCQRAAPELFRLDEHQLPDVLAPHVPPDLEEKARHAAALCPARAIQLESWVMSPG